MRLVLLLLCPTCMQNGTFSLLFFSFAFLLCLLSSLSPSSLAQASFISHHRKLSELVPDTPLILAYHNGPLLTFPMDVHLVWYGAFTPSQRRIVTDFLGSIGNSSSRRQNAPSVSSWWGLTSGYVDKTGASVTRTVRLAGETFDPHMRLGKDLKMSNIESLAVSAILAAPASLAAGGTMTLVLTAEDVLVERFCMSSCGFHDATFPMATTGYRMVPYGWVGNSAKQCPGLCAWPFATPAYGPPGPSLLPPNGDIGMDGMVINIATILTGVATNPYGTGFFQGDSSAPLEAASACSGIFGKGAYPGYPGDLLQNSKTRASFNALGIKKREYLVPTLWNPISLQCSTTS